MKHDERFKVERLGREMRNGNLWCLYRGEANCKELQSEISFHYMQIIERLKGQIESYKFTPRRARLIYCSS
jgi:hypothetical protein